MTMAMTNKERSSLILPRRSRREIRAAETRELSMSSEDSPSSGTAELSDDSSSLGKYSEPLIRRYARRRAHSAKKKTQRAKRIEKEEEERLRSGKGPKYRGLKEIKSSYESFNDALSYRRYRLVNTSQLSGAGVSAMVGQFQRLDAPRYGQPHFSGEEPIEVLQFLSASRPPADDNDIPEGRCSPPYRPST